ncbi:MAG TPA: hypothetical protein DEF47_09085 [Herpetosiphon sp.]|uniref:YvlB/LiaX N-terminal domain-containing protein n=1 Tax=Herpetosiphon aurantiacus (strain ATCC 23779 / DSM 785 / 114-95) TaxID=316274 RepID=A9B6Z1_HERA2|nr:hypothetical protein [Herpetosiphon sp.]ABX05859.1 conserved hypothetical protein [Herpetosiphon aurantiacus DSM 785]MCA0354757.1 hypothetical protein [Chloroflexota bacterium]HBW50048.1 hypothetical protein [Herpetosiphon sp.]
MATEERMRILRLIENGQLTAEEGARLLGVMEPNNRVSRPPRAQWVRIRVTDLKSNHHKINVNIPVGLISIGLKLGARFASNKHTTLNFDEMLEAIRGGMTGKIVDMEDLEDGERIEIVVE